jgi:DNA-binding NtrC family response regulator
MPVGVRCAPPLARVVRAPVAAMNRRARVLVIGREANLGESLAEALTLWGYDVEVVADGPDGRRHLETARHDLVVTDVVADGVTGSEIGGALLARDPGAQVVVVSSSHDRDGGRRAGRGVAVLKRPFELRDLRRAMDRCLRHYLKGSAAP